MRASWLLGLSFALWLGTAAAELPFFPEEFRRADVIAIERDGRDVYGFDSVTGRRAEVRLEVGEEVLFERARGRIGLLLTDRRALAMGPGTGFEALRYQVHEDAPSAGLVEDEIALVVTSKRLLGFLSSTGVWVEEVLPPSERADAVRIGAAVGIVATNRRALGLASGSNRFVGADLRVKERLESISAQDTLATLRTNLRILVFSSPGASWAERDRALR